MYLLLIQQNPSVMPQSVSIILQGRHWRPKSSNNCRCSCSNSKRFNDSCERHLASLASWTPLSSNKPSICHNLRQLSTQPTSQAEFCWGSLMYFVYIHHHPHQQPLSADILSFCVRKQRLWTWGLDRSHGANAKGFYDLGTPFGFLWFPGCWGSETWYVIVRCGTTHCTVHVIFALRSKPRREQKPPEPVQAWTWHLENNEVIS